MKIIRILLLAGVTALLVYGLWRESHAVKSFSDGKEQPVSGSEFIKGATTDRYIRSGPSVYDKRSAAVGGDSEKATLDDCPT